MSFMDSCNRKSKQTLHICLLSFFLLLSISIAHHALASEVKFLLDPDGALKFGHSALLIKDSYGKDWLFSVYAKKVYSPIGKARVDFYPIANNPSALTRYSLGIVVPDSSTFLAWNHALNLKRLADAGKLYYHSGKLNCVTYDYYVLTYSGMPDFLIEEPTWPNNVYFKLVDRFVSSRY